MADPTLLQLLSGADPLAAQMLAASQGQALTNASLDPSFGHNEGLFGALAKTIAGIRGGGMTNDAVQQIVAQRQAALPEILAGVNNPSGPLKYAGQHPGMSPGALSKILSMSPLDVQQYIEARRVGAANAPDAPPMIQTGAEPASAPGADGGVQLPGWGKINSPSAPPQQHAAPAANATSVAALSDGRAPAASTDIASSIGSLPEGQQSQALASLSKPDRDRLVADLLAKLRGGKGGQGATRR